VARHTPPPTPAPSPRRQSLGFRLAAALITTLVVLVVLELTVRFLAIDVYFQNRFFVLNRAPDYPEVFLKDRDLFWRLRPDQAITSRFFEGRTYRINSLGLRGPEPSANPSTARVLLLGNSCTFGWGVDYRQSLAGTLDSLLGGEYEIVNGAVPGYSSLQGRRAFERDLAALDPDVVVAMFGWNDQWAAAGGIPDHEQQLPSGVLVWLQNQLGRTHLYRLLKKRWLSAIEPETDRLFDPTRVIRRVDEAHFRDNLAAIGELSREAGARVILLTEPQPSHPGYGREVTNHPAVRFHRRYNDVVRRLVSESPLELVDAAVVFDSSTAFWDDPCQDYIHFNAAGHRRLAELVAAAIRDASSRSSEAP